MSKRIKIFLIFLACSALVFVLTLFIVQTKIDSTLPTGDGVIADTIVATYFMVIGLYAYLIALNLIVIIGLVISWRRKDKVATGTFKVLTLLTAGCSVTIFLIYAL